MAKPTAMQMYYLGLLRLVRIFGMLFAIGSILTAISNIPGLIETGDVGAWAITLGAGVGFLAIGVVLYIGAGRALNQYRAYIDGQTD